MNHNIEVHHIKSRKEILDFLRFPKHLYKDDPYWVPPLWHDERMEILKQKNSVLQRSEYTFILAHIRKEIVGRVIIYIDPTFNRYNNCRIGFFGNFECIDNPDVHKTLYTEREKWLSARGIDTFRGPINPLAECWGFLQEGNSSPPILMSPYNPKYYNTYIEAAGFTKAKDLLVYEADGSAGYTIPDRFTEFTQILMKRHPHLTVRRIEKNHLLSEAEHILKILNAAVVGNWGFVPVAQQEMEEIVTKLRPILDPDAILFVEDSSTPVGCCLGFLDLNRIIKKINGRLLPFGFLRVLFGIKKVTDYRLWGLAIMPEYSGKGLDVLLYNHLFDALKPKGVRLEANYILEDNYRIKNALEKLNLKLIKKYRVYEKSIS